MIVDFDDYCETNHRLDLLHELHAANPAFRCTLFAIPGCGSPSFWNATPKWCELAVHGCKHPHPREAEHWTYGEALNVLINAHERFVAGFKAPGWQISDATYEVLIDLDYWCADHPDNDGRRPEGLRTHVVGGADHWHGHIQNVCGNGLEERFDELIEIVRTADSFELISDAVAPWGAEVAA